MKFTMLYFLFFPYVFICYLFLSEKTNIKLDGRRPISQRQAILKLIAKKDREKRFVKNWRPIMLLNVDIKVLSKTLAEKLKHVLPELISSNQTAYVEN